MLINQQQHDNLFKAFGLFIEAFRPYVVEILQIQAGDKWSALFVESLYPAQKEAWNVGLKSGTSPQTLIDYQYLKPFALKYRDLLKPDFGKDHSKLATWLETIYEVRNKLAHYNDVSEDEYRETFIHLKRIAGFIKMDELEIEMENLQEAKHSKPAAQTTSSKNTTGGIPAWFQVVKPHIDICQGRLDESVFAANLADVAIGMGREIYTNADIFFSKTYFTAGLKNIVRRVIQGLNGGQDSENRVVSLQTGFGGGKTHTLISLYHLAKWGKKAVQSEHTRELLLTTGEPNFESANIAVFTNTTNDPTQGRHVNGLHIRTLWGELAYQLGGLETYELIRLNDEKLTAPKGLFKSVLAKCKPSLILIDELADYCVSASAVKVESSNLSDQTISFMQELTESISGTDNCVLIATLPISAQELAFSPVSSQILIALQNRFDRVGANLKPIEDEEIFEVVRRRLFEDFGNAEDINSVVYSYSTLYQSLQSEIPSYASKTEYRDKLRKSYPFHPELIDMFRLRWASNSQFQRTRGVLRILAAITSDLWRRQTNLTGSQFLIHTSDVVFSNVEALANQITKLNGNGWDSVISADVSGTSSNAFRIDKDIKEFGKNAVTQGIAATILLGTFGSKGQNKGIGLDELKLCMIKPDSLNHNDINGALDRMEANAHYLYYSITGQKRYWFETSPNVNILINQAKGDIKNPEIVAEILKRISQKTKTIQFFKPLVAPSDEIPEQMKPTLVILSPVYSSSPNEINKSLLPIIEKIATKKGNSERIYRNTMLFLICSEISIGKLHDDVKNYLACQKISAEYNSQLNIAQKHDLMKRIEEANKLTENSIAVAYSIVAKHSAKNGIDIVVVKDFKDSIDNQINTNVIATLKEEEWLLESIGLNTLITNNLTPNPQQAIKVKDIYEAFLRFDDKPMITSAEAVTKSLLRFCFNGEFCIAAGDGKNFTKYFLKESVPFFDVTDTTYWLIDKSLKPQPKIENPTEEKKQPDNTNIKSYKNEERKIDTGSTLAESEDYPKKINSITIKGKINDKIMFSPLNSYFVVPFKDNNIEIEVTFKISSTPYMQLDESKPQYKSAKESAKQLGFEFVVE